MRLLKPVIACILAVVIQLGKVIILNIVKSQFCKNLIRTCRLWRTTVFAIASIERIFVVDFSLFIYRNRVYNRVAEFVVLKIIIIAGLSLCKRVLYTLAETLELKRLLFQVIEHVKKILLAFGDRRIHEVVAVLQLVF